MKPRGDAKKGDPKEAAREALDYLRKVVAGEHGYGAGGSPSQGERREAADIILRHVGWTMTATGPKPKHA